MFRLLPDYVLTIIHYTSLREVSVWLSLSNKESFRYECTFWYSSILHCAISLSRTLWRLVARFLQATHAIVGFLIMGSLIRETGP